MKGGCGSAGYLFRECDLHAVKIISPNYRLKGICRKKTSSVLILNVQLKIQADNCCFNFWRGKTSVPFTIQVEMMDSLDKWSSFRMLFLASIPLFPLLSFSSPSTPPPLYPPPPLSDWQKVALPLSKGYASARLGEEEWCHKFLPGTVPPLFPPLLKSVSGFKEHWKKTHTHTRAHTNVWGSTDVSLTLSF